jgi:hypothetical protein
VKKKFGLELSESAIWSESFKMMKELNNLRPLLLEEKEGDRDKILNDIKTYFTKQSKKFLNDVLD